ncbi:Rab-like protein 6 [Phytophthora citrophthora]|uniref:Rab-like protein 6 n=1 Tax=Phytophthora citrophthora TaxID=4793 RepID=A0AAD9LQP1_9STRA|nr:Rab-like protein 6 [Phytophthora citrophthora]
MGNEVSRPSENLSPQNSGVVPPRSPYTPTGGSSRRAQSFNARSPSPSTNGNAPPPQRRTSSSSSLGSNPSSTPTSNPKKERTIQRMDKAIRRRVRGGITYNMKLLIRGAKGTGKTSLFHRLKGEPIPETHQSTPQLQSATINWSFRQNLEENVKCEVWDVVDKGFIPMDDAKESSNVASGGGAENGGLQGGGGLSAEATAAAAAAAAAMQNGTHSVAIVDASTVDVYHEAHGVIFLLDVTKWDTLEYVKQQLDYVPVHIPTLVLGNFRDQGVQRKIFKEDIQELLYGSSDRPQHQQWRRPVELLYFECSLLNCYGLKSLHQYFGIPFLQLKMATIRQQMRIVEGEFAHLKHDVQATISEQRYAEYMEHIKTTGSDIRTGRRGSGSTSPAVSRSNSTSLSLKENVQAQQEGVDDDVSVLSKENGADTPPKPASRATGAAKTELQEKDVNQAQDIEDLPERNSSAVTQTAPKLVFEHKKSVALIADDAEPGSVAKVEDKPAETKRQSSEIAVASDAGPRRPRKASAEEVMHLEDFQVPKLRTNDLDDFYSEDDSDEGVGEQDEDVVVAPADGSMKTSISGVYHKQRFLDSDSSDSDESELAGSQQRQKGQKHRRGSPRRTAAKQANSTGQIVRRSGSPARPKPSSPAQEISTQELQPSSLANDVVGVVAPTPQVAPPPSPPASPVRHSSPRNKDEISVVSKCGSEDFHEISSGDGPELARTEIGVEHNMLEKKSQGADKDELDIATPSNELGNFLSSGENEEGSGDYVPAASQEEEPVVAQRSRVEVATSDDEKDDDSDGKIRRADVSLSSLQASLPIPEPSTPSLTSAPSTSIGSSSQVGETALGHYHKRNLGEGDDFLSLSTLQASLPLPGETEAPLSVAVPSSAFGRSSDDDDAKAEAALHLSDLQAPNAIAPDFATVVPSNDLEAFLNESNSDSEDSPPRSYTEPTGESKQRGRQGRPMVESSDDEEEEGEADQDRFASYSISKKNRSERRRQQKEDLRQLNVALDMDNDPFAPPMTSVTASDSSLGSSDVMEAIRKAQEEAMRMLPTEPANDMESKSSKKKHKHKHKEHKHKKSESEDGSQVKKRSRKAHSKKRRPHVQDDLM